MKRSADRGLTFFAHSFLKRFSGVRLRTKRAPLWNRIGKDGNHICSRLRRLMDPFLGAGGIRIV